MRTLPSPVARPIQTVQRMEDRVTAVHFNFAKGHVDFLDKTKELVREDAPSGMTIHHKVSQSNLKKLTQFIGVVMAYGGADQKNAAAALIKTVQDYMKAHGETNPSLFRLLNNMPLNLAYGPTDRWHHMAELFDGTADLGSGAEPLGDALYQAVDKADSATPGKVRRPKLYRTLSARSLQLSDVDQLILQIPAGVGAMKSFSSDEGCTSMLNSISVHLAAAIQADKSDDKTAFYAASHWHKVGGKYIRAMATSVYKTWNPEIKPATSLGQVNRDKMLEKARLKWRNERSKQGTMITLRGIVQTFFSVLQSAATKYSAASIGERYQEAIEYAEKMWKVTGGGRHGWAGSGKETLTNDNADSIDDMVEDALNDIKYVVE